MMTVGFFSVFQQRLAQNLRIEKIVAHRREAASRRTRHRLRMYGFFLEAHHAQSRIDLEYAEFVGLLDRDWQGGDGDCRLAIAMELDHLRDIHPIDMIGAEDRYQVRFEIID